jgi:hypothetical protein
MDDPFIIFVDPGWDDFPSAVEYSIFRNFWLRNEKVTTAVRLLIDGLRARAFFKFEHI